MEEGENEEDREGDQSSAGDVSCDTSTKFATSLSSTVQKLQPISLSLLLSLPSTSLTLFVASLSLSLTLTLFNLTLSFFYPPHSSIHTKKSNVCVSMVLSPAVPTYLQGMCCSLSSGLYTVAWKAKNHNDQLSFTLWKENNISRQQLLQNMLKTRHRIVLP